MSLFLPDPQGVVLGVDPGRTGAIAVLDTTRWALGVIDMPQITVTVSGKDVVEPAPRALADLVKELNPILICAEKMFCNPKLPNMNTIFKLGRWRGQLEMLTSALDIAFEHVAPADWKSEMGATSDKKVSALRANALFPACAGFWSRAKDHDRAEAALLALYGALKIGLVPNRPISALQVA